MVPFSYNLRSLAERRRTTLASAIGIALVVFVLSSSMMLNRGIKAAMGQSGRADVAVVLRKGSDSELGSVIATEALPLVLAAPGVTQGVGEVIVVATLARSGAEELVSNVQLRGVPPDVLSFRPEVHIVEGRAARPGTDEVIIGKRQVGRFVGVALGQQFELKKNRPATVVGVFEDDGSSHESEVWVDIDTLRASFGREAMVSSVRARLQSPGAFDAFRDTVAHDKRLGLVAYRETEFLEMQSEGTAIFLNAIGSITAFFFSLGAILGAMITMFASVAQRQREIGVLRALGFSRLSILASLLLESLVLGAGSGLVGALASLAMGKVEFATMNFATWSEMIFRFTPTADVLLTAMLFAVVMGVVGGLLPALQAASISPAQSMRR
jgi:putative ABC transport system permease protein